MNDRDAVIQNAEAHFRSAEAALHLESQQRDVAISPAREATTGQSAIIIQYEQQVERQRVEQAAQVGRDTTMYMDGEQVFSLEGMIQDAKAKTE
jgi:hypothetical protein